jgi:hypothetical protein
MLPHSAVRRWLGSRPVTLAGCSSCSVVALAFSALLCSPAASSVPLCTPTAHHARAASGLAACSWLKPALFRAPRWLTVCSRALVKVYCVPASAGAGAVALWMPMHVEGTEIWCQTHTDLAHPHHDNLCKLKAMHAFRLPTVERCVRLACDRGAHGQAFHMHQENVTRFVRLVPLIAEDIRWCHRFLAAENFSICVPSGEGNVWNTVSAWLGLQQRR